MKINMVKYLVVLSVIVSAAIAYASSSCPICDQCDAIQPEDSTNLACHDCCDNNMNDMTISQYDQCWGVFCWAELRSF